MCICRSICSDTLHHPTQIYSTSAGWLYNFCVCGKHLIFENLLFFFVETINYAYKSYKINKVPIDYVVLQSSDLFTILFFFRFVLGLNWNIRAPENNSLILVVYKRKFFNHFECLYFLFIYHSNLFINPPGHSVKKKMFQAIKSLWLSVMVGVGKYER